jgi:hypothetical protein
VSARSISSRSPWRRRLTPRISAASWAFTDCLGAPRPAGRQRAGLDTTRWFRIKQGAKRVMPEAVIPQIDRGLVGAPRRCSLQNQFNYPAAGPSRIMPLQFISGDRDCSFLVGPYPVRERAVFDFERQFLARYRIRPKRRDASLHYCLVLIGSPRCAVVGCKFRKVTTPSVPCDPRLVIAAPLRGLPQPGRLSHR